MNFLFKAIPCCAGRAPEPPHSISAPIRKPNMIKTPAPSELNKNPWFDIAQETKPTKKKHTYTSRLFCFTCAGGNHTLFDAFFHNLGENVQVVGVCLPARMRRMFEVAHTTMVSMVTDIASEISQYLDLPYSLFGHSLGGLVAFEVACALQDGGFPPPCSVYPSAIGPPHIESARFKDPKLQLSRYSYDQVVSYLRAKGGTPEEVLECRDIMEIMIPSIKGDYACLESYDYQNSKTGSRVVVCCGDKDDLTSDELDQWRMCARGPIEFHMFTGGHFYINESYQLIEFLVNDIAANSHTNSTVPGKSTTTGTKGETESKY